MGALIFLQPEVFGVLFFAVLAVNDQFIQLEALTPDGVALLEFKKGLNNATDGSLLLPTWNAPDASPCQWEGIQCTNLGFVDSISLKNLSGGVISPSLGRLQFVRTLDLESGQLQGGIPPELANCTRLEILNLMDNNLSGEIPAQLGDLSALTSLLLSRNTLVGEIPSALGGFPSLSFFNVCANNLMGRVPLVLYQNRNLQVVNVGENNLTGNITTDLEELAKLPNIMRIMMHDNHFTGSLPPSLGNCKSLQQLDLCSNHLDGTIPSSIGKCSAVEVLNVANNNLSGEVPPELGNCTKLRMLQLGSNQFAGEWKVDFSKVTSPTLILSIFNNSFNNPSSFFASMASNPNFTIVDASKNELLGEIPANFDVKLLSKLQVLMLGYNKLQGPIPVWLWSLPKVHILDLSNNNFNGEVVSNINLTNMQGFIDTNASEVPIFYTQDFVFHLNNQNQAVRISYLSYLTYLDISNNKLTGSLPVSIGELANLFYLNLTKNAFTGTIPAAFGGILPLQSLDMSSNLLTGSIPSEFAALTMLAILDVGNNSLSGPIPQSTQLQSLGEGSFLPGNDNLCGKPLSRLCTVATNGSATPQNDSVLQITSYNFVEQYISIPGFVVGFAVAFVYVSIAIHVVFPLKGKRVAPAYGFFRSPT